MHFEIILRASVYACVTVRSRGCIHDEKEQQLRFHFSTAIYEYK